jgi:hypothetical protein
MHHALMGAVVCYTDSVFSVSVMRIAGLFQFQRLVTGHSASAVMTDRG